MALTFGGAAGDRVTIATATEIEDRQVATLLMWVKSNGSGTFRTLIDKGGGTSIGWRLHTPGTGGLRLRFALGRASSDLAYRTSTDVLADGTWRLVVVRWDLAGTAGSLVNIGHIGLADGAITAATLDTTTDGSGAMDTDVSVPLYVGNDGSFGTYTIGQIGSWALYNRLLSDAECLTWKRRPIAYSGCVVLQHLGFDGTGTQADYSGEGNTGTVTTAVVADHNPLGPIWGYDAGDAEYTVAAATYNQRLASMIMAAC